MSDQFVAEIRAVPFNFAPTGWALCNGQLMPISQNTALFSLLGTTYGGDGKSTFALPDLQDKAPLHPGQGPGLSLYDLGHTGGSETVTLLQSEIPVHTHQVQVAEVVGDRRVPSSGRVLAVATADEGPAYAPGSGATVPMAADATTLAGGGLPHNNLMPYLTVNYIIALQGIFPPRW